MKNKILIIGKKVIKRGTIKLKNIKNNIIGKYRKRVLKNKHRNELSNVYLYKTGRFQKDFEYLFDKSKVIKYVVDEKKECINSKYIVIDNLPKLKKDERLIICSRYDKEILKKLKQLKLKKKRDYYWFEDVGKYLDFDIDYQYSKAYKTIKLNSELLKEMIYKDSFDDIKCLKPFTFVYLETYGAVYGCCPGFAQNYIGNYVNNSLNEIWNSNAAKLLRLSIINKTYAFCDPKVCPYIKNKEEQKRVKTIDRYDNLKTLEQPEEIYIAYDRTCNLHCKSCRAKVYIPCQEERECAITANKRLCESNWLNKTSQFVVAGNGEAFYSNTYKNLIFEQAPKFRNKMEILTNGNLMTKENLDKLCEKYKSLKIYISIDAATKETYKKLRLGGNFDKLNQNLDYLSKLKKQKKVEYVELNFVVQRENYKEINQFIQMVKKHGFDGANFNIITNWGTYSDKDFKSVSMVDENGLPNDELKQELRKIKKEDYKYISPTSFLKNYLNNILDK